MARSRKFPGLIVQVGVVLGFTACGILWHKQIGPAPESTANAASLSSAIATKMGAPPLPPDPFVWLEDIRSEASLEWVKRQNEKTLAAFRKDPRFQRNYDAALEVLRGSNNGYEWIETNEGWVYRLDKDATHPRGVWRRAAIDSYLSTDPAWQALLDFDSLARAEGRSITYAQPARCYRSRCMLYVGVDPSPRHAATLWELREFDVESRQFVKGGFHLAASPVQGLEWYDENTLFVTREADSDTAREVNHRDVKIWSRGQPYSSARTLFEIGPSGESVWLKRYVDENGKPLFIFMERDSAGVRGKYWRLWSDWRIEPITIPPQGAIVGVYQDHLIVHLFGPWETSGKTWRPGTVLSIPVSDLTEPTPQVHQLAEPAEYQFIYELSVKRGGVVASGIDKVRGRLWRFTWNGTAWDRTDLAIPDFGSVYMGLSDDPTSDVAIVQYQSFLEPSTMYRVDVKQNRASPVRARKTYFDGSKYVTEQLWAKSKDGTMVPYFLVRPREFRPAGNTPTYILSYPGVAEAPRYDGILGRLWLDRGGVYVVCQHRGQLSVESMASVDGVLRAKVDEDFIAVAEDLFRRKITSPDNLGIRGHSRGGLLVTTALNTRPDLYNAGVAENPVLDLWVWSPTGNEYGKWNNSTESEVRAKISSYQNVRPQPHYPPPLITTNTDDEVYPWMARKFAAKMESLGMPYYYYEGSQGGHYYGLTVEEIALHDAMVFTYFAQRLGIR